ncbi:MAG: hypothetical protein WC410_00140 [Candidatus Paceibacterota bacterium]|jgi:hypothetical protein
MPKKLKKKAKTAEELPEEGEAQKVGFKPAPAEDKDGEWEKVDAVFAKAKESYLAGSTFDDVISSLIATLEEMRSIKTEPMGGMGVGEPEMNLPAEEGEEQI